MNSAVFYLIAMGALGDVYGSLSLDVGVARTRSAEADAVVESPIVGGTGEIGIKVREGFHGTLMAWGQPFLRARLRNDSAAQVETTLQGAGLGVRFELDEGWFVGGALCALIQSQSGIDLGTGRDDIGGAFVLRGGQLWSMSESFQIGVEVRAFYGQVDDVAARWNPAGATLSFVVAADSGTR